MVGSDSPPSLVHTTGFMYPYSQVVHISELRADLRSGDGTGDSSTRPGGGEEGCGLILN